MPCFLVVAECCGSFGGPTKDGWALNARAVGGIGPVAEVENRLAAMLGLEVVIEGDGAVGVGELVGDTVMTITANARDGAPR